MSSRRSARLSARVQVEAAAQDAPSAVKATRSPPAPKSRKRKVPSASASASPEHEHEAQPAGPPATPKRPAKKTAASSLPSAPTATPSAVRLIAEPAATTALSTPEPKPPRAVAHLAGPDLTNASLLSPETSRVVSYNPTTTANVLEEACAHLIKVEPRIEPLITAHHCRIFSPAGLADKIDPFESLASGIISQQVSGAAAKAIKTRFIDLFDHASAADATTTTATNKFPTPSQVAAATIEKLRSAGLSQRKAEYIQGLAAKFAAGELTAGWLADAPYEEVLERLIAVRGLGRWSVEMFACFGLKRMDVFSTGDLGVQRGMAAFAGRDVSKLKAKGGGNKWKYMSEREMIEMAAPFSPYRSLFMWYMWRVEETDISTLE
ncbi:HhH-GPD superfamily base excision DNA repair protein [Diaporthe helianthi]|uniref:HhH-GPD superfamily base excision DNA repair protein n=1 Tax=Diaporthe helianthi TaxID=158607 RepID=A0A2P5HVU1_DIAHE|nr:HhH-GPD superfamily base excision DNA repair protein [Diaporthe helianthi]